MDKTGKETYRVAVYGYGKLGKGAVAALRDAPDLSLYGVFSRRGAECGHCHVTCGIPVYAAEAFASHAQALDAVLLCVGSATDLPRLTPALSALCNVIDSFDTHAVAEAHFTAVDAKAKESGHLSLIGAGWDPGLFSIFRVLGEAFLPTGVGTTFWGPGVSQGHSEAVRRIAGVADACVQTLPNRAARKAVLDGQICDRTALHRRICTVAPCAGADCAQIAASIRSMPHYFAGQSTEIRFVTAEALPHTYPHGGDVIRNGQTENHPQQMHLHLSLSDNPTFTGSILCACARAVCRMRARGRCGAITMTDLAPADLLPLSPAEIRARLF